MRGVRPTSGLRCVILGSAAHTLGPSTQGRTAPLFAQSQAPPPLSMRLGPGEGRYSQHSPDDGVLAPLRLLSFWQFPGAIVSMVHQTIIWSMQQRGRTMRIADRTRWLRMARRKRRGAAGAADATAVENARWIRLAALAHDAAFTPFTIPTRDGIDLAAELISPSGAERRGTIVFVHGFCGNKGENGLFRALAAYCATCGFEGLLYDWRGIGQSEGDFASSTLSDHVSDFEQVVEWAASNRSSGAGLIHAVGFSLGAAVVGLALRRRVRLASAAFLSPAVRPTLSMWPRYDTPRIRHDLANLSGGSSRSRAVRYFSGDRSLRRCVTPTSDLAGLM